MSLNHLTLEKNQIVFYIRDNKAGIYFEDNFKNKTRIAILNSKLYETSVTELKDKIGTNIGLFIEEMLDKESDS